MTNPEITKAELYVHYTDGLTVKVGLSAGLVEDGNALAAFLAAGLPEAAETMRAQKSTPEL